MGNVTDFFRPLAGSSLCEMLSSHSHHMWAAPSPAASGAATAVGAVGAVAAPSLLELAEVASTAPVVARHLRATMERGPVRVQSVSETVGF